MPVKLRTGKFRKVHTAKKRRQRRGSDRSNKAQRAAMRARKKHHKTGLRSSQLRRLRRPHLHNVRNKPHKFS